MNEYKTIEVSEDNISVSANITSNNIEIEEETEDVAAQTVAPVDLDIEDEDLLDIEIEEVYTLDAAQNSSSFLNHSLLNGREFSDQHPISAIAGLREELDEIETVKRVYSSENGLSEFRKWNDGNPNMENRAGYFVKLVQGTENIDICTDTDDVYGIAVINSGFVGGQIQADKSDDPSYAMVGIAGALRVRTDGTARDGEYVVPNALGEATCSENNCGYKVISQGSYASYPYVTIAVTPQNDKLSKIYGMLTDTSSGGTLGNLVIQIEDLENQLNENSQKVDIVISDNESIRDIISENQENIKEVADISNEALKAAQEAQSGVAGAVDAANEATQKAQSAALEAQNAVQDLADVTKLADEMQVLISFEHNDESGMAGLVAAVSENTMNLGSLMQTVDEQGSDLAATIIKSDANGVAIQNLVSHVDKYSVGEYSVSYGLSQSEAASILVDDYIYVPTVDHTESMTADDGSEISIPFVRGYSYDWDKENTTWVQSKEVSMATTYQDGSEVGDLWLCWQDVEQLDENGDVIITYVPRTLYRWSGNEWIAVATIAENNQGRILTSVKQTAEGVKTDVVNMRGEFTTLEQTVDGLSSRVGDAEGNISSIDQEVDSIQTTISNINGTMSSLQQRADDTDASIALINTGRFHILYQSFVGTAPDVVEGGNKYSLVPIWDDEQGIFVFNEEFVDNTDGIYYFFDDDKTKYCKIVDGGYEIYTIGNQATSLINSRIDENEAGLDLLTKYVDEKDGELRESVAVISAKADANGANINYVTSYYYHTLLSVSTTPIPVMDGELRYSSKPTWDPAEGKYVFDINDRAEDGAYYLADSDGSTYCRVTATGDGTPLYEIYGLAGSYVAAIEQGADEDGGYIQSIVMDIERYNVGKYSPSYGMSYDDAVTSIPNGTMYVPTELHSENLIPDERISTTQLNIEELSAGTLEERESSNDLVILDTTPFDALEVSTMQTYDFEVDDSQTYSYEWTGSGWQKGDVVSLSKEYYDYDGTENTSNLWYCTQDVTTVSDEVYKQGTLYSWHGGRWFAIATANDSLLSRSISLVRQTANSYSIELRNMQGDFSQYKQTVDNISLLVGGSDGSSGEFNITKEGIVGEVYNRTGNSATLKAQADSTQAILDLMIAGIYHKLETPLTDNVPSPYEDGNKYSSRPEWNNSLGKFVFYEHQQADDGIYYFFDEDETHYCKVVGEQYEVYTIGTLSTAGTDAHITEEYANINTLAYFGDDETSTIAGLKNLALEGKAQIQLLASLDNSKLIRVVNIHGYSVSEETKRYDSKPIYLDGAFTFDGQVESEDGEYFLISSQQFGKLIVNSNGVCYGYEVYEHDSSSTAGLVSTVLDNQANVGMIVDSNGVRGSVVVEAINGQSEATISADKVNLNGYVTVTSLEDNSTTTINGAEICSGVIKSNNYVAGTSPYSDTGTYIDLSDGSITSKNFAIDDAGNLHLKGDISASNAKIKGGLQVGSSDGSTYNFVVDTNGNVSVKGTLDATALKINGQNVLTGNKIKSDYLELKGLTIKNSSDQTTFSIDSNGNVTIAGSMSWSNITDVPDTITGAYGLASDALDVANGAATDADDALQAASNAEDTIGDWSYTYDGNTYIDSSKIYVNELRATELKGGTVYLLDKYEQEAGYLTIGEASTGDYAIELYSDAAMRVEALDGALYLSSPWNFINLSTQKYIFVGDAGNRQDAGLVPANSGNYNLGATDYLWGDIYATNDVINTSDMRKKKDIGYALQKYESFFFSLKPTQYKFVQNTSNRYHIGFISQDVESALMNNGLESSDFAGFIKSPLYTDDNETVVEDYQYGLRYGEFIALNTHMIQKLYKRIEELETKLSNISEEKE